MIGISGALPENFFSVSYEFEDYIPKKWPNLVIFDFSINCESSWTCAKDTDRLIYIINHKYSKKHLDYPAYMFIDLFSIGWFLQPFPNSNTTEGRLK